MSSRPGNDSVPYLVGGGADKGLSLVGDRAVNLHRLALAGVLGVAKVHDFRVVLRVQHNVLQLQIAVEEAVLVHVRHALGQLLCYFLGGGFRLVG